MRLAAVLPGGLGLFLLCGCGGDNKATENAGGPLQVRVQVVEACVGTPTSSGCGEPPCPNGSFFDVSSSMEFAAFKGDCPSDTDLTGTFASGALRRVVSTPSVTPPDIGRLPDGKYGFAVFLRNANCYLMGFGCTAADTTVTKDVQILAVAWDDLNICQPASLPGCRATEVCTSGACD